MENIVTVRAPATVANVGPGFDVLGFALERPCDELEMRLTPGKGKAVMASLEGFGKGKLPENGKNLSAIAAQKVLDRLEVGDRDITIRLKKGLPATSGIGSSAASIAGALHGANKLLGGRLGEHELLKLAVECEGIYSGFHADNVAPCLLGGFVLVRGYEPLEVLKLGAVDGLFVSICTPEFELSTKKARSVLPAKIQLRDAVKNSSALASLVYGIARNDAKLVAESANDCVVEPCRATLIPGFADVKKAALGAGAKSCSISGSGPSVFAFSLGQGEAEKICEGMAGAFRKNGLASGCYVSRVSAKGTHEF